MSIFIRFLFSCITNTHKVIRVECHICTIHSVKLLLLLMFIIKMLEDCSTNLSNFGKQDLAQITVLLCLWKHGSTKALMAQFEFSGHFIFIVENWVNGQMWISACFIVMISYHIWKKEYEGWHFVIVEMENCIFEEKFGDPDIILGSGDWLGLASIEIAQQKLISFTTFRTLFNPSSGLYNIWAL